MKDPTSAESNNNYQFFKEHVLVMPPIGSFLLFIDLVNKYFLSGVEYNYLQDEIGLFMIFLSLTVAEILIYIFSVKNPDIGVIL